jgi:NIMA (never in mitosis gene a)-related kinase
MEYANKGDLYQKICEFKKAGVYFEESDIFRIFIQIARGLKALHDMKILHRDLKSANVFLYNDGSAKLGDLNVSKVARRGLGYTQTGTPYYASPEVWKDQPYDSKSDIWSLGCVLYEMITLRPPFRAENMEGLYNKVIKGQYSKIPEKFSSDLVEMVKFLLQVHPENRPTADQILKNPIIQKRMEFFKTYSDDMHFDNNLLLQTIKIPKNLLFLTDRLPQANYEKSNVNINKNQKIIEKERIESQRGSLEKEKEKEKVVDDKDKDKEKEVVSMKMKSDNHILERIKIVEKEKEIREMIANFEEAELQMANKLNADRRAYEIKES